MLLILNITSNHKLLQQSKKQILQWPIFKILYLFMAQGNYHKFNLRLNKMAHEKAIS